MSIKLKIILMATVCLCLAVVSNVHAQTPTTGAASLFTTSAAPTTGTSTATTATPSSSAPLPQGAGSDNNGYISFKGYVFHIIRGDDPSFLESDAAGNTTAVRQFDYGTEFAGKAEAGYNGSSGWGFRVSYFHTNQTASTSVTATATAPFIISPRPLNVTFTGVAAPGTTATFKERLRIQYVDAEGSYKWKGPNFSTVLSAGIRIAPTEQLYTANDIFVTTPEVVTYRQKRTGVGPTVALDLRHRLGSSNFWVTAQARFALLFGKIKETASYTGIAALNGTATRNNSRTTTVFEGEAGIEYAKKFGSGKEFFINFSFAFHEWWKLVNVMPTPGIGTSVFAPLDNPAAASTRQGNVGLVGGSFSFGFRF